MFEDSFTQVVTITFTALIISELLNINTAIHRMNKIVCISQVLTLIIYIASIITLKDQINVSAIDLVFVERVGIIVVFSWGPLQVMKIVRQSWDPTEN
jgi:phospholipid-translocating ATPase